MAVASSIKTIGLFLRTALAIQTSYFSPALKLSPWSSMWVSNPFLDSINSVRQHLLMAYKTSSSLLKANGSMLSLMVPLNNVGSCIIIVIDSLSYLNEIEEISWLSINNYPFKASKILKIVNVIVDFPAPVLPTIPIFSLGFMTMLKFFKAKGNPSLY